MKPYIATAASAVLLSVASSWAGYAGLDQVVSIQKDGSNFRALCADLTGYTVSADDLRADRVCPTPVTPRAGRYRDVKDMVCPQQITPTFNKEGDLQSIHIDYLDECAGGVADLECSENICVGTFNNTGGSNQEVTIAVRDELTYVYDGLSEPATMTYDGPRALVLKPKTLRSTKDHR